ncbi:MAG: MCE family protein [Verrucomicrobia bacterium]|nr:MCE family protein [Verrucomicrobiota bacterium]MBV9658493.1 MCE family protein [Verrucomicrobiota bacterium]
MTFEKNEVRTGLLVLVTSAVLIAALLLIGVPGLFKKQKSYRIFFDNAAGVKPGAAVALAGRKIGQVVNISSPVPKTLRPTKSPEAEVLIEVRINEDARVYRDATARMSQLGLLGEQVIDFIEGNEDAGAAESGYTFVGERSPDFSETIPRIIRILEPVASNATLTLDDLRKTIASLNVFFDKEGELQGALAQIKNVAANLALTTAKEGSLGKSLDNIQKLTAGLADKDGELQSALANLHRTTDQLNKDDNLAKTLANFEAASRRANTTMKDANALVASVTPTLNQAATNFNQMTDTLKRQPWRLIYPTTKKYDTPTTTVANVPRSQGGPATLVTRERRGGGGAATTTVRPEPRN